MYVLVKKDTQTNNIITYVGLFCFLLFMYIIALPPSFLFILCSFAFGIGIFSYDDKNSVNRFLLSMPIEKSKVVISRYLYAIGMILYTMAAQLVIMFIFHLFNWEHLYVYTWQDIVTLFGLVCIILALCFPIIYALTSLVKAMFFILLIISVGSFLLIGELVKALNLDNEIIFNDLDPGFALIVERYFLSPTYLLFLLFSLVLLYLSMILSIWIFKKKDY